MAGIVLKNDVCMLRKEISGGFTLLVYGTRILDGIPCRDWVESLSIYPSGYVHDILGRTSYVGFDDIREYATMVFELETLRRQSR